MSFRARLAAVVGASVLLSSLVAAPSSAATVTAAELPGLLTVAAETTSPSYDRDRFEHWIDADGDGCNTRYEVLIEESTSPVSVGAGCALSGGTWVSPYDGVAAFSPAEIEIDHVVALAEAWRSGAAGWTDDARRAFANDLDVPYALTAASSVSNQSKSDKDPAEWLPTNGSATCEYVMGWALTKYRWSLSVDPAELAALETQLSGTCGQTAVTLPQVMAEEPVTDPGQTVIAPFTEANTRLGGADRYAVSVGISKRYSPGVPVVYIAKGTDFPDALSAAAAASRLGGPLLLTPTASLHKSVATELSRLQPHRIVVVGGTGSITAAVFNALAAYAPEVVRVGGADRYEASRNVTTSAFTTADTAMIATGRTFPDALAASGVAGKLGAPVLLVDGARASVPSTTMNVLRGLGVSTVYVAGGPGSVSPSIVTQLQNAGFAVTRFGGATRYDVAASINAAFFPNGADTAFFTTGLNFPDALSGAALAGRLAAPLFVTTPGCLPPAIRDSANAVNPSHRVYLGGTASVSDAVVSNLGCLAAGTPSISGAATVTKTLTANPGSGWTPGTSFTYRWYANSTYVGSGKSLTLTAGHYGKKLRFTVTGTLAGYTSVTRSSGSTSAVGYPSRTAPVSAVNCPSWAPIKGNADSMIYHVPSGRYYAATHPEECFRTESAAVAAGYRKSKL